MSWFKRKEKKIPIITAEEARKVAEQHLVKRVEDAEEKLFNVIMEDIRERFVTYGSFKHIYDVEELTISHYVPVPEDKIRCITDNLAARLAALGYKITINPEINHYLKIEW